MQKRKKHIARRSLSHCWEKDFEKKKMVYLGATAGWGKTAAVKEWLNRKRCSHQYISAKEPNLASKIYHCDKTYIVIDDLQFIDTKEKDLLVQVLETFGNKRHFLLIGRMRSYPWLHSFIYRGDMVCYHESSLMFQRDEVVEYLDMISLPCDMETVNHILIVTKGYPLGVSLLIEEMVKGREKESLAQEVYESLLFQHYDIYFENWEEKYRRFVIELSFFQGFSLKMAKAVSQCEKVPEIVSYLMEFTGLLHKRSVHEYYYDPWLQAFVEYIREKYISPEEMREVLHRGALFYEDNGEIAHAMEIYYRSGDLEKLSLLLMQSANDPSEIAYDYRTIPYYRALPKESLLSSPELMASKSMICSLLGDSEESEYWYCALEEYVSHQNKGSQTYQIGQGWLSFLRIALPHRGSKHLASILKDVSCSILDGHCALPEFSASGNFPSLINGRKDLCRWIPLASKYYHFLKEPIELLFKNYGVGLADIALGEAYFERGDSSEDSLILLHRGKQAAAAYGMLETEFAAIGVLVRIMVSQNGLEPAIALVKQFQKKAATQEKRDLYRAAAALLVWLALYSGNQDKVAQWMLNDAPNENNIFYPINHDCYLTKVRCYILQGRDIEAMSLLSQIKNYAEACDRIYLDIKCEILFAILEYRMGQDAWQSHMTRALTIAEHYRTFRAITEEGIAVLVLLQKMKLQTSFERSVLAETMQQAVYYPDYLMKAGKVAHALTETENKVLRLMENGQTNEEIAAVLHISVRTVKYHLTNIYAKLEVKNCSQAIKAAHQSGLL